MSSKNDCILCPENLKSSLQNDLTDIQWPILKKKRPGKRFQFDEVVCFHDSQMPNISKCRREVVTSANLYFILLK